MGEKRHSRGDQRRLSAALTLACRTVCMPGSGRKSDSQEGPHGTAVSRKHDGGDGDPRTKTVHPKRQVLNQIGWLTHLVEPSHGWDCYHRQSGCLMNSKADLKIQSERLSVHCLPHRAFLKDISEQHTSMTTTRNNKGAFVVNNNNPEFTIKFSCSIQKPEGKLE